MTKLGLFLSLALAFTFSQAALAFPHPVKQLTLQEFVTRRPTGNLNAANFRAIVALSNCSGSLVRFENSQPSDPAMVMTNGHCLGGGFLKPGEVRVDQPVSRSFALLNNDGSRYATLQADRVLVATMTKTDITLYRLTQSYADIGQKYGVQPLVISSKHPAAGTPIAVISGYWKRIYSCNIDRFIFALKEANWTFRDSVRYTSQGCNTIGGTSGSPIVNTSTYEIIGINNTGNEDGQRCTMNNPCEVDENGNVTVVPHASYGQETFWLYTCLDGNRHIDLKQPNCALRP